MRRTMVGVLTFTLVAGITGAVLAQERREPSQPAASAERFRTEPLGEVTMLDPVRRKLVRCQTLKCINRTLTKVTNALNALTGAHNALAGAFNCLQKTPVTQYGDPFSSFGYEFSPDAVPNDVDTFPTSALDLTFPGDSVSFQMVVNTCP
jgi:hypothetical protein